VDDTLQSEEVSLQSLLTEPRPQNLEAFSFPQTEKVSLESLLTQPKLQIFEVFRRRKPRRYTTSDAVAGRQHRLVLERYGVTVLKLSQSKVILKSVLCPGPYTTSDAVAGRQHRLVLERYGVTVLKLSQSKVVLKSVLCPG
jgi:hypothetical protein